MEQPIFEKEFFAKMPDEISKLPSETLSAVTGEETAGDRQSAEDPPYSVPTCYPRVQGDSQSSFNAIVSRSVVFSL